MTKKNLSNNEVVNEVKTFSAYKVTKDGLFTTTVCLPLNIKEVAEETFATLYNYYLLKHYLKVVKEQNSKLSDKLQELKDNGYEKGNPEYDEILAKIENKKKLQESIEKALKYYDISNIKFETLEDSAYIEKYIKGLFFFKNIRYYNDVAISYKNFSTIISRCKTFAKVYGDNVFTTEKLSKEELQAKNKELTELKKMIKDFIDANFAHTKETAIFNKYQCTVNTTQVQKLIAKCMEIEKITIDNKIKAQKASLSAVKSTLGAIAYKNALTE